MIETQEKITKVEDLLAASASKENKNDANVKQITDSSNSQKNQEINKKPINKVIPRGKPVSGRVWKEPKKKFSSIIKTKGIRLSLDKKNKLREDLKKAKELSRELKAQKLAEKLAKKERTKLNLKRAEENRKKGEVVQVIKNTAKVKRMKKKQLRLIEKRDTVQT